MSAALLAARPAAAVTMSAGAVAYELYGVSGVHEVVHGQFISAGWAIGKEINLGLIYEYGIAFSGGGVNFSDYGVFFEKNLPKGMGVGLRISQATAHVGGAVAFREMIFGVDGRVPIKQFSTASLGVVVGCIYAPNTPAGAEVSPRIALVGKR